MEKMNKYQKAVDWLEYSCDCEEDHKAIKALNELIAKYKELEEKEAAKEAGVYICPHCGQHMKFEFEEED